ncbi:AMP-binding protein [Dactylosporangium sp. CA-092794]|uniref:AMP-binding protein n=1 Tax=Dactylosporangium sp. CA-092794 TaxID=3239929 RepID=UPI003D92FC06
MSIEQLSQVLVDLGVEVDDIYPGVRLRAGLALDSVETAELEIELRRQFAVQVDLWDAHDYSLGELAALVEAASGAAAAPLGDGLVEAGAAAPVDRHHPEAVPTVPAERARAYRDAGWWRAEPLHRLLLGHAGRDPDKCALVGPDRRLSHGELRATVARVAGLLRDRGIGPGDRVVVQLPNSVEFVVLLLALISIGAPPVLVTSTLGEYELDRILEVTEPVAVAVPASTRRVDHLGSVRRLRERHRSIRHVLVADPGVPDGPDVAGLTGWCASTGGAPQLSAGGVDPTGAALFLLSSGTTGPSKVMARTHEDYGYVVRGTSAVAALSEETVYLAVLPSTHTFTLAYPGIMGTLAAGGTVVLGSAQDPRHALELVERERVTHTAAVPGLVTQWVTILRTEPRDVSSLGVLQVGGARLDRALAEAATAAFGCVIQQVYGMSEGLGNFTRLDDPREVTFATQGRPASPGDEILIVAEDGTAVAPGTVGELLTRGPSTVAGYFRDPAATQRAFTEDGFYRTGDLVRLRPDGNLEVTGRIKNLINRGGEKVSAEELEELTRELPEVAAVGAAPMPHPVHGEAVCLFVVPADGSRPDLREVRRHLQARGLAGYKLPERLEHLDSMPLVGVGKVDRNALRQRAQALVDADRAEALSR